MWLTIDWLVKFPFQKLLVLLSMSEGRNSPVIQEIREQPSDLERRVCQASIPPETQIIPAVQQPVDG